MLCYELTTVQRIPRMDTKALFCEVEDIMCDQVILSEVDVNFQTESTTLNVVSTTRFRLIVALFVKTVLPAVVGVYSAYLRNKNIVIENVRKQLLPSMVSFLANRMSRSLAYVQEKITYRLTFTQIENDNRDDIINNGIEEKCVECMILAEPDDNRIKTDVIFVHGLHGGLCKTWRQGTWRHERHKLKKESLRRGLEIMEFRRRSSVNNEYIETHRNDNESNFNENINNNYSPCWPQDWLPKDCPGVRVIAINYTTDPYLWRPVWVKKRKRTTMTERSKEMIELLLEKGVGENPIVWVGHSKGGLFIKQILVDAYENDWNTIGMENLLKQTKGIAFYSVPHKGSFLADVTMPLVKQSVELLEIQRNCAFVLQLHHKFLKLFENNIFNPNIISFIETSLTLMSIFYLKIVTCDSADPNVGIKIGVPLDHREICKPAGRDCFLYLELVKLIDNSFMNNIR